jgi:hypothetical protein
MKKKLVVKISWYSPLQMTKQEGKFGVDALVHLVPVYLGPVQMDKGRYVLSVSVNIYKYAL